MSGSSSSSEQAILDSAEEWQAVEQKIGRLVRTPTFVKFNARQVMRLPLDATGDDVPHVILSSMTENIRRSGSYKAAFYFGGRNLYPTKLVGKGEFKIKEMVSWFTPIEALSVLTLVYFNRYLALRSPVDGWSRLAPLFREEVALGRKIGLAWPAITPGRGMLVAGLRRIASGFMLLAFPEELKRFGAQGMFRPTYMDPAEERKICGFSHLTVASYLSQQCGLGVSLASSFNSIEQFRANTRRDEKDWREVHFFLEEMRKGRSSEELQKETPLAEGDSRKALDRHYDHILKDEKIFDWLSSEKEDTVYIRDHKLLD